jgi:hypothetical protein
MVDWLPALAAAGKCILIVGVSIFVITVIALAIYAVRNGEPRETDVAPDIQPSDRMPRRGDGR